MVLATDGGEIVLVEVVLAADGGGEIVLVEVVCQSQRCWNTGRWMVIIVTVLVFLFLFLFEKMKAECSPLQKSVIKVNSQSSNRLCRRIGCLAAIQPYHAKQVYISCTAYSVTITPRPAHTHHQTSTPSRPASEGTQQPSEAALKSAMLRAPHSASWNRKEA